jgi:hypothetical protein
MSDPWEDEGFGGEDDWEAAESLETDLEDDDEGELEDDELVVDLDADL